MRMRLARTLGRIAARWLPVRRPIIEEHLAWSFPGMSEGERAALVPDIYGHTVAYGLEFLAMRHYSSAKIAAQFEQPLDDRGWFEKLRQSGKGFIIVSGHLGSWDWAGVYLAASGHDVAAVARRLHDPTADRFAEAVRRRHNLRLIFARENPREMFTHLRRGGTLGIMGDQDARRQGIFVPFFGRAASTTTAPARIAYRLGVPILPSFTVRTASGRLRIHCVEPIWPDLTAPAEREIERLTRYHVQALERAIVEHPAQYFWVHRRWKTRPPNEPKREKTPKSLAPVKTDPDNDRPMP